MARYCTIPKIFGFRHWFEPRFSAFCQVHDLGYKLRVRSKWAVDMDFAKAIWNLRYVDKHGKTRRYRLTAVCVWLFVSTIGLFHWYS
jgi:hypothetical protein